MSMYKKGNLKYQKCAMASLFRGFRKVWERSYKNCDSFFDPKIKLSFLGIELPLLIFYSYFCIFTILYNILLRFYPYKVASACNECTLGDWFWIDWGVLFEKNSLKDCSALLLSLFTGPLSTWIDYIISFALLVVYSF